MNAEIITVGAELLLGNTANADGQFLSHELAAFGVEVTNLSTVGADPSSLREALRLALGRSRLVVLAGGLGDGDNDCALSVLADILPLPLERHEESLERIREYFVNTCREMPANAERQAWLPKGSSVFPNDHGTAPGCAIDWQGRQIFLLPGAPRELMPMFSDYVAPYLSNCAGGTIVSRTVGVFGLSEAVLTERLADLMSEANPNVAAYSKDGEAILRVTAHAANRADALALCAPVVDEICRRLGVNVYGVDVGSLQKAVVALLLDKQMKIATAESCTAGLLSGRLTEVAGVSAVFECGVAAYSKEIKHNILGVPNELLEQYGAVSPKVASAMAVGARRVGNADLGVGITGVAGPDTSEGKPVGTVYVALADEKRVWVKKIDTREGAVDREYIRYLATSHALDLVRRYLEALPTVMAGGETLSAPPAPPPAEIPQASPTGRSHHFLRSILPWKGDSRGEIVRKSSVLAVFLLLIAVLAAVLYMYVLKPMDNQRLYNQLVQLYDVSAPQNAATDLDSYPEGMLTQFYALYARNQDIRGWLKIDGTNINYPVMRGTADSYYATHNFNRQLSSFGVPYFDPTTALLSPDSVNRSLVIYGNNAGNGQMFSDLTSYYDNLSFLREHPLIEMNTIYHNAKWKVFSVLIAETPDEEGFDYTRAVFDNETDFLSFAGELRIRSLYSFPDGVVDVQEGDSLLLLSTDFSEAAGFSGARLVVAARQLRSGESETVDLGGVTFNSNALMPKQWRDDSSSVNTTTTRPHGAVITRGSDATAKETTTTTTEEIPSTTPTEKPSENPTTSPTPPTTTTTKAVPTTTTTEPDTVGPTTQPEPQPPTTVSTSASTSGTTPTTPTSATPPPPADDVPPVLAGNVAESSFLKDCKVRDTATGETIVPANKQELQLLLARIVKKELGSSSTYGTPGTTGYMAAQKAQAIASYTYILYYTRSSGKPYSCRLPAFNAASGTDKLIYDAVGEVAGIKLLQNNAPICATYFASSAGVTADNKNVFGADLPYLKSVVSAYDTAQYVGDPYWEKTLTLSRDEVLRDLTAALSDPKTGFIPEILCNGNAFAITEYDVYGKYTVKTNLSYINAKGYQRVISGYQFASILGLRSHAFTVVSSGSEIVLKEQGFGHGVGMSQWGAAGYAKHENWDYRRILSHYYSVTSSSGHRLVAPVWA